MARNVEILSILLLFANILGAQAEAECEGACDVSSGYCKTTCYYHSTTDDVVYNCIQEDEALTSHCVSPDADLDDDNTFGIKSAEDCQRICTSLHEDKGCIAYRFHQTGLDFGPKYYCDLLKKCLSETDYPYPVNTPDSEGEMTCKQPTEPKTCSLLGYTGTGPNIVHWKCVDPINGIILNPYETRMESGTECSPMHLCNTAVPIIGTKTKLACLPEDDAVPDSEPVWKLTYNDETPPEVVADDVADVECPCPELKIAASEGTVLACTTPVDPDDDGFFTLTNPNTCTLYCDNYFITELTCGWLAAGSNDISWISSWRDNTEEVTDACLSCWENGCTTILSTATSTTTIE